MRMSWKIALSLVLTAVCPLSAFAGWGIGVNIGIPVYRPYYGYPYCYRPYPYYVVPPPIVVAPAPVVQAVPVYPAQSAYAPPVATTANDATAPPPLLPVATNPGEVEQLLTQLNDPEAQTRATAAVQLGRLKSRRALDPLIRMLGNDRSPVVRDAAARGLGMIGAPGGLAALQHAAQSDDDRDVRHSAQFAAEVIRANLQGR